jgi:hypothetical protein
MIKFDSSNNANYFIKYHNRMRNLKRMNYWQPVPSTINPNPNWLWWREYLDQRRNNLSSHTEINRINRHLHSSARRSREGHSAWQGITVTECVRVGRVPARWIGRVGGLWVEGNHVIYRDADLYMAAAKSIWKGKRREHQGRRAGGIRIRVTRHLGSVGRTRVNFPIKSFQPSYCQEP